MCIQIPIEVESVVICFCFFHSGLVYILYVSIIIGRHKSHVRHVLFLQVMWCIMWQDFFSLRPSDDYDDDVFFFFLPNLEYCKWL